MATQVITKEFIKQQEKRIDQTVRTKIVEIFREILTDPDYGLELKDGFVNKLKKSIRAEQKRKMTSLDKILKKYNL